MKDGKATLARISHALRWGWKHTSGERTRPGCGRQRPAAANFCICEGKTVSARPPKPAPGPGALPGAIRSTFSSKCKIFAFSLIEVVLAVGIVSFALLAIFGMFGVSLKTSADAVSQQEVAGMTRSLNDFLRSTNPATGFSNVSNWIGSDPGIYCFVTTNGRFTNAVGIQDSDASRSGRLFRAVLSLSPNAAGISNLADVATNAIIPLQVRFYSVPSAGLSVSNLQPVYTYDTAISR